MAQLGGLGLLTNQVSIARESYIWNTDVVKNHDKVLSAEQDMVNDYKKMYEDYNWPQQTLNEPERTSIIIFGAKNGENVMTAANYKLMV